MPGNIFKTKEKVIHKEEASSDKPEPNHKDENKNIQGEQRNDPQMQKPGESVPPQNNMLNQEKMQQMLDEMTKKVTDAQTMVTKVNEYVRSSLNEINQRDQSTEKKLQDLKGFEDRIQNSKDDILKLAKLIDTVKEEQKVKIHQLQERMLDQEKEIIQKLEAQIIVIEQEKQEETIQKLEEQITIQKKHEENIEQLEERMVAQEKEQERIQKLEEQMMTQQNRIQEWEQLLSSKDEKIQKLEARIVAREEDEIDRIVSMDESQDKLNKRLKASEKEVRNVVFKLRAQDRRQHSQGEILTEMRRNMQNLENKFNDKEDCSLVVHSSPARAELEDRMLKMQHQIEQSLNQRLNQWTQQQMENTMASLDQRMAQQLHDMRRRNHEYASIIQGLQETSLQQQLNHSNSGESREQYLLGIIRALLNPEASSS